jgi:hypothetical protein
MLPYESGCADCGYVCCDQYQCNLGKQCCSGWVAFDMARPMSSCELTTHERTGCAPKSGTFCGEGYYCDQGDQCCEDQDKEKFCSTPSCETFMIDRNDYDETDFDEVWLPTPNVSAGASKEAGDENLDI